MLLNDNYLSTTLNGAPRYDKPILIYWFQALSVSILGATEWTYRLPSAFFSLIWLIVFGRLFMRHLGKQVGRLWSGDHGELPSHQFYRQAAIADALLNMWLAMAGLWTWEYHLKPTKKAQPCVFRDRPGLPNQRARFHPRSLGHQFFVLSLQKCQLKTFWKMTFNKTGLLIFFGVASPWYIAVIIDQGQAFIDGFFMKHNVGRFKSPMEGHHGSFFTTYPWPSSDSPPSRPLFAGSANPRQWFQSPLHTWLAIWVLFVFAFFSLSGHKLPHYVIYGYTPLMILMATTIREDDKPTTSWFIPGLVLYIILGLLPGYSRTAIAHHQTRMDQSRRRRGHG